MADQITIDAQKTAHEMTVSIRMRGVYRLRARIWMAVQLLKLVQKVSGLNIVVDTSEAKPASE